MIEFRESDIKYVALSLPDEVNYYKFRGEFALEVEAIKRYLEGELYLPLRRRLEIELVIASVMQMDYLMNTETLIEKIQRHYPLFDRDALEHIVSLHIADYIVRDGERYFQRSAVSNILNQADRYLHSLESGVMPPPKRNALRHECLQIMRKYGYRKVRYRIKEWIEINESAAREGAVVRAHLPYPSECAEQSDIVLHGSSHPVFISDAEQRTAYIETEYRAGETYWVDFSYTLTVPYREIDVNAVSEEQPSFYTHEQLPQIRFTPMIREIAESLRGEEKNPLVLAWRAYEFVTKNVTYSYMRDYLCIDNIPEFALHSHRGDCGVMALLFITLCRALGVPARWQSGSHVRPNGISSHDWAQFYVAPYGWLYCDPSFGGGALRAEDEELWRHYFGGFDTFREINCTDIATTFDPPKRYMRTDPYDNQSGEIEYADAPLFFGDYRCWREVLEFEDLTGKEETADE
jgi:hypothetical protein